MPRKQPEIQVVINMPTDQASLDYIQQVVSDYLVSIFIDKLEELYPDDPTSQRRAYDFVKEGLREKLAKKKEEGEGKLHA